MIIRSIVFWSGCDFEADTAEMAAGNLGQSASASPEKCDTLKTPLFIQPVHAVQLLWQWVTTCPTHP